MKKSSGWITNTLIFLAILLCTVNQFRLTYRLGYLFDEYAGALAALFGTKSWLYLDWTCLALHVLLCLVMAYRLIASIVSKRDKK